MHILLLLAKLHIQKGQALLEALIAMGIAVVVITGITIAISSSLQNSSFSKNQQLAASYAQEAIEIARQLRDDKYTEFLMKDGLYCLNKGSAEFTTPCPPTSGKNVDEFLRTVKFFKNNCYGTGTQADLTRVEAEVSWESSKCTDSGNRLCHKSEIVTCLSDQRFFP